MKTGALFLLCAIFAAGLRAELLLKATITHSEDIYDIEITAGYMIAVGKTRIYIYDLTGGESPPLVTSIYYESNSIPVRIKADNVYLAAYYYSSKDENGIKVYNLRTPDSPQLIDHLVEECPIVGGFKHPLFMHGFEFESGKLAYVNEDNVITYEIATKKKCAYHSSRNLTSTCNIPYKYISYPITLNKENIFVIFYKYELLDECSAIDVRIYNEAYDERNAYSNGMMIASGERVFSEYIYPYLGGSAISAFPFYGFLTLFNDSWTDLTWGGAIDYADELYVNGIDLWESDSYLDDLQDIYVKNGIIYFTSFYGKAVFDVPIDAGDEYVWYQHPELNPTFLPDKPFGVKAANAYAYLAAGTKIYIYQERAPDSELPTGTVEEIPEKWQNTITIRGRAADEEGIRGVYLRLNDSYMLLAEENVHMEDGSHRRPLSSPAYRFQFDIDASSLPAGQYSMKIIAEDMDGDFSVISEKQIAVQKASAYSNQKGEECFLGGPA